jgi:3-methyladenine DNA glycosylase/8-oxoguanine DNA glycosylase
MQFLPGSVWRATRTPSGPATTHFRRVGIDGIAVRAWGPGAEWVVETAPRMLGEEDDASGFRPTNPLIGQLHRRFEGLRITRTGAVVEALVPTITEQKVTSREAHRAYAALTRRFGEGAPGPLKGLLLPPDPATLAAAPSYAFHPLGIERKRGDTIRRAAAATGRLEEANGMAPADAARRLQAVCGVGPWSAAEVALVALGDADAVPLNDYHLPAVVSWALTGEAVDDDDRMLDLLEPYRGHRGRVIRLLVAAGSALRQPRRAPRSRLRSIAAL